MTTNPGSTGSRALRPVEKMTKVADEGFTLNFGTSARVEGEVTRDALRRALDTLVLRHPLLGAAVDDRGFRFGGAAPIALREVDASVDDTDAQIEDELQHCVWPAEGPRARCVLVRHGASSATLVLTLHHVVSDGSSGVIAMRDLLAFLADPGADAAPLDSPGQDTFYPAGRGATRDFFRALGRMSDQGKLPRPHRVGHRKPVAADARRLRLHRIRFDRDETAAILRGARAANATAHGAIVGSIAKAIAHAANATAPLPMRVMHPVDMRRYLTSLGTGHPIGDAVGYYVSSVETDHDVAPDSELGALAHAITHGVRAAKENGEPFLTAPTAGRLLVLARSLLGASRFLDLAERTLLQGTFSVTNLGELERLGVREHYGPLRVVSFGFVASPSIFGPLCASASTFGGELEVVIHHVEPRVDAAFARAVVGATATSLRNAFASA